MLGRSFNVTELGDLTVNRIGFGAMRLTSNADGTPSDRDRADRPCCAVRSSSA